MENPDNRGAGGPRPVGREESLLRAHVGVEERRLEVMENRRRRQPYVHEQIQRFFRDYQPPWYVRLRGYGHSSALAAVEEPVITVIAAHDQEPTETQIQALTEHCLSGFHTRCSWEANMTGLAAYMTYRGRRTWRFPFVTPNLSASKFNPATGGPHVKLMWHAARFFAYCSAIFLVGKPLCGAYGVMQFYSNIRNDRRLATLLQENKLRNASMVQFPGPGQPGNFGAAGHPREDASMPGSQPDQSARMTAGEAGSAIAAHMRTVWAASNQEQPPPQQPPQREEQPSPASSWGDGLPADLDDASPVAPSAQNQQSSLGRGSSWDRIRQQSKHQHQPRDPQQAWRAAQQAATDGWGGNTDDASPQHRGPRDSYNFSSSDEDKAVAKSQAQKEFDELLERERRGVDQERTSWSKR